MTELTIDSNAASRNDESPWEVVTGFGGPTWLLDSTFLHSSLERALPDASSSWATEDGYRSIMPLASGPKVRTICVARSTSRRPWYRQIIKDLGRLFDLPPNWNGYGEAPVDQLNAARVLVILDGLRFRGTAPELVPLHDGSLQAEWHAGKTSLEMEFPVGRHPVVWWTNGSEEREWPLVTHADLLELEERVRPAS